MVGDELADAVADFYGAAFKLYDADGNAVEIKDDVGAAFVDTFEDGFFEGGKVVGFQTFPLYNMDGFVELVDEYLRLCIVTEELSDVTG